MKKLLLSAAACAVIFGSLSAATAGDYTSGDHAKPPMETASDNAVENIVSIALADESFSTLVAALKAGDLVGALQGDGPFTVFAPTNDAFAALPEGTLDDLLKPENKEKLQEILKYHVIAADVPSSAAAGQQVQLDTLAGAKLDVDGSDGVKVGDATVIKADIGASNGIIHVIDKVLIP
jgi:uncharacterized surface protein with fasciclin (FAS1) repeats